MSSSRAEVDFSSAKHLLGTLELAQRLGIWEWLPATNEMVWSDGLYQLLDLAPTVAPSMAELIATVHPADRVRFETHLARARRERGLLAFRCRIGEGAAPRTLQVRMQRTLAPDGSLRSVVGTSQDITDDATTSITTFTGALAHQINNPLAVISMFLQMLPKESRAGDALDAVDRIKTIIGDLKLFSHGDTAMRRLVRLDQIIAVACAELPELHARATVVTSLDRTPQVRANVTSLVRVVVELLRNALDAVADAELREIHIATRSEVGSLDWALLEVTDTGAGIPASMQGRIFEPFVTTKGTTARGLGLSIARGIVDSLGGSITVQSHTGGARFLVALPSASSTPTVELEPLVKRPKVESSERGSVLVVDDETLFVNALSRLLSGEHDVAVSANGQLALERIERGERFDAIVCDLTMPVMTGAELYSRLQECAPDQSERMIFVTGGAPDRAAEELLARMQSFEKPCDVNALREAVRRRVAQSRDR